MCGIGEAAVSGDMQARALLCMYFGEINDKNSHRGRAFQLHGRNSSVGTLSSNMAGRAEHRPRMSTETSQACGYRQPTHRSSIHQKSTKNQSNIIVKSTYSGMMHRIYRAVAPQITPKCRATWISQTTEKLQAMLATEADGDKSTTRKQ